MMRFTNVDEYGDKVEVALFPAGDAVITNTRKLPADGTVSVILNGEQVAELTEFLNNNRKDN